MPRKYTLNVYPKGAGRTIYRVIEFPGNASLDKLCETILSAFDFMHEHMYEFCMDNRPYKDYNLQSHPDFPGQPSTNVKIDKLGLVQGQIFSLHYDFGDDWMFAIRVVKIEDVGTATMPRVVKRKGTLIQYPSWDEDEDEDYYDDEEEDESHPNPTPGLSFPQLIAKIREDHALTYEGMGKAIGKSAQTCRQYEKGSREPRPKTIRTILSVFHVNVNCLLYNEGSIYDVGYRPGIDPLGEKDEN